jgi:hypothetical protein
LDERLGGSHSQSGRGGEEKSSQLFPGLEPSIIHPVAQSYSTELSRFLVNAEKDLILLELKEQE